MEPRKPREPKVIPPNDKFFFTCGIRGQVDLLVLDEHSRKKERRIIKNIVTHIGDAILADLLASNGLTNPLSHIAVGDGTTAATKDDTQLENELLRESATRQQETGDQDNVVRFEAIWPVGAAQGSYTEAGIFDADTAGNLFSRTTFTQLDVGPADTLLVRWYIQFLGA
jgi:phosphopentomutase